MGKYEEKAVVIRQEEIATDIYSIWLKTINIAGDAKPGQFVGVYCEDGQRLLPRPISICEIDKKDGAIRLVYRIAGKGTNEFSELRTGREVRILGPLGNGYNPLDKPENQVGMVIGGGIGIPPMLELAKQLKGETKAVLGFRDELFLMDEFRKCADVTVATDTGRLGIKGTVIDAIIEENLDCDVIYACGPMPMLRAVKAYAGAHGIPCYISLEEHMACGIGACLGCVAKTVNKDEHSHVNNTRICTEGPVFNAMEVEI